MNTQPDNPEVTTPGHASQFQQLVEITARLAGASERITDLGGQIIDRLKNLEQRVDALAGEIRASRGE